MKKPDVLGNFYLFRDAAADDLMAVEALVARERYAPSQLIFREGDNAQAMYLVELGTVSILKSGSTELTMVGSGGEFGELAFFDGGKRAASARAREATHVLSIPFVGLSQLLERWPSLAWSSTTTPASFSRSDCVGPLTTSRSLGSRTSVTSSLTPSAG